jgi:hypothetical protein
LPLRYKTKKRKEKGEKMKLRLIHVFLVAMAVLVVAPMCISIRPVDAQEPEYGKIIWFVQIPAPGGPAEPITHIEPCTWYRVVDTEPYEPGFTPEVCSWWHIFWPNQLFCIYFHVDANGGPGEFHIDLAFSLNVPAPHHPIPPIVPPVSEAEAVWIRHRGVGGTDVPVNKVALLAPYIGATSTTVGFTAVAVVASVLYVKRRKKKQ